MPKRVPQAASGATNTGTEMPSHSDQFDTITPDEIGPAILQLCRKVLGIDENASLQPPIYVPIKPVLDAPVNWCFPVVAGKIERDGGSIQHGWIIWEVPDTFIEAEFHAFWVSPSGEYVDVMPRPAGFTRILYLPDPKRVWTGEQIDNIRMPLRNHPLIEEFIRLAERKFQIEAPIPVGHAIPSELYRPLGQVVQRMIDILPELRRMSQVRVQGQKKKLRR